MKRCSLKFLFISSGTNSERQIPLQFGSVGHIIGEEHFKAPRLGRGLEEIISVFHLAQRELSRYQLFGGHLARLYLVDEALNGIPVDHSRVDRHVAIPQFIQCESSGFPMNAY